MNNWFSILARPYPLVNGLKAKLIWATSFSLYVFLFLLVFKPFGLADYIELMGLVYALTFGAITFCVMLISFLLLPLLFPCFFDEDYWTTGREILLTLIHIFLIGIVNFLFMLILFNVSTSIESFLYIQLTTLSLAVIPVAIWTLVMENRLLRKNMHKAEQINSVLDFTPPILTQDKSVKIRSVNKPERILYPEQLVYLAKAGNYVKVRICMGRDSHIRLIQTTLTRVEEDLSGFTNFLRCHKDTVVNLDKVESVQGNARGLRLQLRSGGDPIPISKAMSRETIQRLNNRFSRAID